MSAWFLDSELSTCFFTYMHVTVEPHLFGPQRSGTLGQLNSLGEYTSL